MHRFVANAVKIALAMGLIAQSALPGLAQQGANLPLIRDAEIESLMRIYSRPIFKVAGISEGAAKVYLVNQQSINAFVAGGQRIFINTGLLAQAKTPNEVIGVLAHETGHIAGGHLARMGAQVDKASTQAIIGMLLGAAAIAGGVAAGSQQASQAGAGVFMGSQGLVQRNLLAYVRAQESAADQAAIKFLDETGQSGRGMLTLFERLAAMSMGSLKNVNPYVMTHPMPLDRIRNLEISVKKGSFYNRQDPEDLLLRHRLMQAKLAGYLTSPQQVFQQYPRTDKSLPGRYARAIAAYRMGDLKNALRELDSLTESQPAYAYFWELKGQALLESGRAVEAVAPLQKAVKLSNGNGLIQIMLAKALLQDESPANAQAALKILKSSMRGERDTPILHAQMAIAYARLGNIPLADLSTAEAAILKGDKELASQKATLAAQKLKQGSPEWIRAKDILNFTDRKKS
jgi:predicted Zn-dependent protease